MNFITSDRADDEIASIVEYWEENRDVGSALFLEELKEAEIQLLASPHIGQPWRRRGRHLIRRWLLKKTHYHVYYVHQAELDRLLVVAIWASARREPKL